MALEGFHNVVHDDLVPEPGVCQLFAVGVGLRLGNLRAQLAYLGIVSALGELRG